jgi:hypothetical protein
MENYYQYHQTCNLQKLINSKMLNNKHFAKKNKAFDKDNNYLVTTQNTFPVSQVQHNLCRGSSNNGRLKSSEIILILTG